MQAPIAFTHAEMYSPNQAQYCVAFSTAVPIPLSSLVPRTYPYPMDYMLKHSREPIQVKTLFVKKMLFLKLVPFTDVVYCTSPNSSTVQGRR